ncbi:ABC transporter ATP-binding protein [Thalassotalea agarivorans]|uniref:Sodium transport system ATP-binding protein n=1 Tax=Thalassotalea agarivorans TaxID=349064 RepID=A0A1I0DID1_THASX|nr:ATP-binding cassette domain-containing protein [Thalassotalea agarivorans]SET32171.1 sodium transport system ATP-binding protein [Thalassotalea agarivorans]
MIEVKGLSKSFKLTKEAKKQLKSEQQDPRQEGDFFHALTRVDFACKPGQVLGLLGPNGAGKTTTLRILASSIRPDRGEILVNNVNIVKNPEQAKKKIGFLSTNTGLYQRLTAKENIEYFAKLHGMSSKQISERAPVLYEELGITEFLHRRAETLSTGMKQKVSIARAVVHQPDVLVLDEPTTGLDIMATETVLSFIENQKAKGTPIIFSTHHLEEVTMLADEIVVINHGKSCFRGTEESLKQQMGVSSFRKAFMHLVNKPKKEEAI